MEHHNLGNNDNLRVSKIGVGIWQASGAWKGDDEQVIRAIGKARELGVNLIDTAEMYGRGHSESVLGKALKEYGRDDFFVATKVAGAHLRYDELQKAAAASMKRLGVDVIDLFQIHWPDPWEQIPMHETMKAMEKLHSEGKIRSIGVSNFAVRDLEEARSILSNAEIVSNQVRYNLLQRNIEEEVVPYCRKNNISILAWSPLSQGALTGKYNASNIPKGDVRDGNPVFATKNMELIQPLMDTVSSIASAHNVKVSQVALNWLGSHPEVVSIPGAKTPEQAAENIASLEFKLSDAELKKLDEESARLKIDYMPEA